MPAYCRSRRLPSIPVGTTPNTYPFPGRAATVLASPTPTSSAFGPLNLARAVMSISKGKCGDRNSPSHFPLSQIRALNAAAPKRNTIRRPSQEAGTRNSVRYHPPARGPPRGIGLSPMPRRSRPRRRNGPPSPCRRRRLNLLGRPELPRVSKAPAVRLLTRRWRGLGWQCHQCQDEQSTRRSCRAGNGLL